jgi:hypothetical protein
MINIHKINYLEPMIKSFVFCTFLFISNAVFARIDQCIKIQFNLEIDTVKVPISDEEYSLKPYWIEMMDNPKANYFEVQKAFNLFWKGKTPPVRVDNEARDIFNIDIMDVNRPVDFVYEYKRYKFWERYYKDLLDENGFIISPEEMYNNWLRNNLVSPLK